MNLELEKDFLTKIISYCKASSSSLSLVDSSYRRNGHGELRLLLSQMVSSSSSSSFTFCYICSIIQNVLLLLKPPLSSLIHLDALPLPLIQSPLLLSNTVSKTNNLHVHVNVQKSMQLGNVQLAQDCCAPLLSSSRRGEVAFHTERLITSDDSSNSTKSTKLAASGITLNRLQDHSQLFSWAMQAPIALDFIREALFILINLVESFDKNNQQLSTVLNFDTLTIEILCDCSHFLCYTPWTFPEAHKASHAVISLLAKLCTILQKEEKQYLLINSSNSFHSSSDYIKAIRDETSPCISISHIQELHYLIRLHADVLLEYCRSNSIGGRWKSDPSNQPIRFLTLLTITSLRFLTPERLSVCIPLGLRLSDDSEPENTWLGVSILCHILSVALPTDLRTHPFCAPLIKEAITRAEICGSIRQHPIVSHALSHLSALSLSVLYGSSKLTTSDDLLLVISQSALPPQQSSLDSPFDVAVFELLKKLSLSSSSHIQYVVLDAFGTSLVSQMGYQIVRHFSRLIPALFKLISKTGDARVAIASLTVLKECILAAPSRFILSQEEEIWINNKEASSSIDIEEEEKEETEETELMIDIRSRFDLRRSVLDICSIANHRANVNTLVKEEEEEEEGNYILPIEDQEGCLSWTADKEEKGGQLVTSFVLEIKKTLEQVLEQAYNFN
jgi:hypothetical protein